MTQDAGAFAQLVGDKPYPERIKARLLVVDEVAQRRATIINERSAPFMTAWGMRFREIQRMKGSIDAQYHALYALVEEVGVVASADVACKRGCSHCCHIAVAITEPEAKVMGRAIGIAPKRVKHRTSFKDFDYGYHNPCTFLRDGECSIYAHRPLACRTQYNVDVDSLLCELTPPLTSPVPYLNMQQFVIVGASISMRAGSYVTNDIRAYFPKATA